MSHPDTGDIAADVPAALDLASGFEPATDEQWQAEVLKVVNRGRPSDAQLTLDQAFERLTSRGVDAVAVDPLYVPGADRDLGFPGVAPFTRGATVRTGQVGGWDVRALHEDPDPAVTRDAIRTDLERGVTSIHLRVDPDAIRPEDVSAVLADVLLDLAKVSVTSRHQPAEAAEALLGVYASSDKDPASLSLNLGLDPIGHAARHGATPDLSGLADWVARIRDHLESRALTVDAAVWHDAGAGDIHELAWLIAGGIEYVRALIEQGVSATDAFGAINFRVTATTDQFATIARLRALRTLWSRVGEVFEVDESARGAKQWAVQSWREITRDDAYNNILRSTVATFAAAAGGAEAITTLPFDTAWGLPTAFARRISRNTQVVLAEESNIGRVNDPAGGSYYVDELTRRLEDAAWAELQRVEGLGGLAQALVDGDLAQVLADLTTERRAALSQRTQPITGVSSYPNPTEDPLTGQTPRPAEPATNGLPRQRDAEIFEELRDRTRAGGGASVFLACLGTRREFGAREGFAGPLFQVAGLATPTGEGTTAEIVDQFTASGSTVAVLCSNAATYAEQGAGVADALRSAGAAQVLLAGAYREVGEGAESHFDGRVYAGVDVVDLLTTTLDTLGVPATTTEGGAE